MDRRQRQGVALKLYSMALFGALGIQLPYLPRWLEAQGIVGLPMGLVAAGIPIMGLVGPLAFGLLADAFALRGLLLRVVSAGAALSFAFVACAAVWGHPLGFVGLFVAVLAYALCRSTMISLSDTLCLEQVRATSASYGSIRMWGSVGFLLSALAAGRWLDPTRVEGLPIVLTVALFLAFLVTLTMPSRSDAGVPIPSGRGARRLLKATDFRLFLGTCLLSQLGHSNYDLCFSLHLRDLGADGTVTGVAWAIGVLCEIGLMAASGAILRRFSARQLLVVSLLGSTVRWTLIGWVRPLPALLALQPLHVLSFSLMWIAALAYIRERVPLELLATAQGLFSAACAAGTVAGMVAWGPLYRRFGGDFTFTGAAGVAVLGLLLAVAWSKTRSADPAGPETALPSPAL